MLPVELENTHWGRKLYLTKKNKNSFVIFTKEEKDKLDKKFSELDKNPDNVAFNRFILSGIVETKSVNALLELPVAFEDFYDCEVSFLAEGYSVSVTKV